MKLKRNLVDESLHRWFEIGISYNLMLGVESNRKELNDFECLLNKIDPIHRIQTASLINQAFFPHVNVTEIMLKLLQLNPAYNNLSNSLYCIVYNWPHWSWELLINEKRSILSAENILKAYYDVRKTLDMTSSNESEIHITNPTLIALYDIDKKRKLTSKIVSFRDYKQDNRNSICCVYAHNYFKNNHTGIHQHILNIANDLSMGKDPLDKTQFKLLNKKKYTQWSSILQALFCYCAEIKPQSFINNCRNIVPREYLYTANDSNSIKNQLPKLNKRQGILNRFIRPLEVNYSNKRENPPLNYIEPHLVKKMILCHFIMFYMTALKELQWSKTLMKYRSDLKSQLSKSDFDNVWFYLITGDKFIENSSYHNIKRLFESDPIGLPPWAYNYDVIPEPLDLLEKYFGDINHDNDYFNILNEKYFHIALIIPLEIKIDLSAWLKSSVWLRTGNPLTIYGPSKLQLSERLHLAGLIQSNQYLYQTLAENLTTINFECLGNILMGICYLWHSCFNKKVSLSKYHEYLSQYSLPEISIRTLTKRKNIAANLLDHWPNVNLLKKHLN